MSRYHEYSQSEKSNLIQKISLIFIIIAPLVAGYLYLSQSKTDKNTLCPDSGPTGHIVVLIDNTDPYSFIQHEAFTNSLKVLAKETVKKGELLSIYNLNESFEKNAKPIFEKCNPGTPKEESELTSNLKKVETRFNQNFYEPIQSIALSLTSKVPSTQSPIFEMLQLASINSFQKQKTNGEKTLIIFSDMLHNTDEFSMFKPIPEFDEFLKTAYGQRTQTDFQNINVHINYLMNYPKLQTRKQLHFWEKYFEKMGGKITKVTPMEG